MSGRIPSAARKLLVRLLADQLVTNPAAAPLRELARRGLVKQHSVRVDITPERARRVESWALTDRGIQVAEQLTKRKLGHGLCWDE